MRKAFAAVYIVICIFAIHSKSANPSNLSAERRIIYKNINESLEKKELGLLNNSKLYLFSGLTDSLPYTITEDDIGVNELNISDGENKSVVKVVVSDASRPVDRDGWTILEPGDDSQKIYVSSSQGDDSNDGLSPDSPVRTLQAGVDLVRSGVDSVNGKIYPDWLLLKRGDEWDGTIHWRKSGRSLNESAVISSYGSLDKPRPVVNRIRLSGGASWRGAAVAHNWVVRGLRIRGISLLEEAQNLLIEDCFIDAGQINFQSSRHKNIEMRRNIVHGNYSRDGSHSQGIFSSGVRGLLFEENIFDHNGWHAGEVLSWNSSAGEVRSAVKRIMDDRRVNTQITVEKSGNDFLLYFDRPVYEENYIDAVFHDLKGAVEPSLELEQEFEAMVSRGRDKPVLASSIRQEDRQPEYANDGNRSTRWTAKDDDSEAWWQVDLEEALTINRIVLISSQTREYKIEYSRDGEIWNLASHITEGLPDFPRKDELEFDSIKARYWRFKGIEQSDRWGYSIYEMKLFGPEDEDIPECLYLDLGSASGGEFGFIIPNSRPTIFNHNFYVTSGPNTGVRFYRNIVSRGSATGIGSRNAKIVEDNVIAKNPINMFHGWHVSLEDMSNPEDAPENTYVRGNLYLEPVNIGGRGAWHEFLSRGWALELSYVCGYVDVTVSNNLIIANHNYENSHNAMAISSRSSHPLTNLSVENNIIYNWRNFRLLGGSYENVTVRNNIIQYPDLNRQLIRSVESNELSFSGNTYYRGSGDSGAFRYGGSNMNFKTWKENSGEKDAVYKELEFIDPTRTTLGKYNAHLGGKESFEAFIDSAMKQSRHNWSWDYSPVKILKYFREGFTPITPPKEVDGLNARTVEDADGEVMLEWKAPPKNNLNEDNTGGYYEIRYATYPVTGSPVNWWNSISTETGSYYSGKERLENPKNVGETEERIVRGLYPGATFYFGIRVYNLEIEKSGFDTNLSEGNPASAAAGNTDPGPPSKLRFNYIGTNARLVWDKSPSSVLKNYIIHKSTLSEGPVKSTKTVCGAETEYDICLKEEGYFADYDKYYFTVTAVNIVESTSTHSNEVKLTPDVTPPVIEDLTARTRVLGRKEIKVSVTDDRQVYEVGGGYRSLGSGFGEYQELEFFPDPEEGSPSYEGSAEIDEFYISSEGFEYYITASDAFNTSTTTWVQVRSAKDLPEQGFITPNNPELIFGSEVKEVLITDVRGNEVFSEKRGSSNYIVWNPSRDGSISLESGLYIYRIKIDGEYKYGSVVIAK